MKKLSKAQERELETIKEFYTRNLERDKQQQIKNLSDPTFKESLKDHAREYLDMLNKGFIYWTSPNSKTLERIAEAGFIDYIKQDRDVKGISIDYIRLKDNREA